MRPTNLSFRSPKEKTGEYVLPMITCSGNFDFNKPYERKTPLYTSKRFSQYEIDAKRTGLIGPGEYDLTIIPTTEPMTNKNYKTLAKEKLYIDNYRVYDIDHLLTTYQGLIRSSNKSVDLTPKKQRKKSERCRSRRSEYNNLPYLKKSKKIL